MRFGESAKFTNTWNAVFVDGDWRIVQCNWAARHLVSNRNVNLEQQGTVDKLRYQYDEHYFLTDPDQFIFEFFPFDKRWQLMNEAISLQEFEELPFVRSTFFHLNMAFLPDTRAVLEVDEFGFTHLQILVSQLDTLVCHYQLRFAEEERNNIIYYRGAKLDRFVFFSVNDDRLTFDIRVPAIGAYFLEVFAAPVTPMSISFCFS